MPRAYQTTRTWPGSLDDLRLLFMGGNFSSFSDLNSQLQQWLLRVNSTIQGTTHEIPIERLKIECLNQIDGVLPYEIVKEESRKISKDAFISYLGNGYFVPYKFAGRVARLQIQETTFTVFAGKELVCRHDIIPGHGKVSRNKDHFKGLLSEILTQITSMLGRPTRSVLLQNNVSSFV